MSWNYEEGPAKNAGVCNGGSRLEEALQELEAWKTKTEKANDEKDRLLLKKMEESDTKAVAQQKVFDLMKGQDECKEEFSTALVQNEILQIGKRQQDLQEELKSLQLQLKDKRMKTTELSQRFKVIAKSLHTKINFTGRNQEERTNRSQLIRGVFAVSQRPFVLLQGQHALITFEEEKVASHVLKMPRCPVSAGADRLFVKPKKVALKSASRFEVHLSTCRKTLKVSNIRSTLPEERIRDRLEMSFSRPSQGGGEVESLEYKRNLGTGQVTFLQPGVSETLALKGSYRVDLESGVDVEVAPNYKEQLDGFQTFSCSSERTVLLADIDDTGDVEDLQDQLEIHFQKPGNGGGEIENIVYVPKGEALQAVFLCEAMETEGAQS
ncbi:N-myc-interactor [Nelusetta ayraudi]|uniref:N-myc-interactor n=1 Tax=Nelusetta ayraudi TaxID=303726 RepID=UPI003F713C30